MVLVSMETPEPGLADGEERLVELRPRTRSNPEGAEDRRSSMGSLGGNMSSPQPAVGSRVEGEGEASTSDSPPNTTTTSTTAASGPIGTPAAVAVASANAVKERPKPSQPPPPLAAAVPPIPPIAEYQLRAPRANCPEKVVCSALHLPIGSQLAEYNKSVIETCSNKT